MKVIGHRGAPSLNHENTLASFKSAFQYPVNGIELDVQLSKDNQLVIFHDLHTYQLNGKHELIRHYTLNELRLLKPTIPTLSEILTILSMATLSLTTSPSIEAE